MKEEVNPIHYRSREKQCIEFARHLDYDLGNAFKYTWRNGLKKDAASDEQKAVWYLKDAVGSLQKSIMSEQQSDAMIRQLILMADEFRPEQLSLLVLILAAAAGDYSGIQDYLVDKGHMPAQAMVLLGAA